MSRDIRNTLDSLLKRHFGKGISEAERESALNVFKKKCASSGFSPAHYINEFKQREVRNPSFTPEVPFEKEEQRTYKNSQQQHYNKDDFFNDTYGKGFGGFGGFKSSDFEWEDIFRWARSQESNRQQQERQRRERERKEREERERRAQEEKRRRKEEEQKYQFMYPPNTIRGVRFKVKQSKYSWATIIDCEEFVKGHWAPRRLVLFSDEFEFPRGYKDHLFVYETNGKTYFGNSIYITKLYYFENGRKILIYDADKEKEERNSEGKPYTVINATRKRLKDDSGQTYTFINYTIEITDEQVMKFDVPTNIQSFANYFKEQMLQHTITIENMGEEQIEVCSVASTRSMLENVWKIRVKVKLKR